MEIFRSVPTKKEISGSETSPLPVSLADIKPVMVPGLKEMKSVETEREGERLCEECEDGFSWPDSSHHCYYTQYKLRYIAGDIVPAF